MPSQIPFGTPLRSPTALRHHFCKVSFSILVLVSCLGIVSCLSNNAGSVATAPVISLSATSINFGSFAVGTTGGPRTVTVTNSSSSAVTISAITITGADAVDFSETNNCTGSLVAGGNCSIKVTFKPSAPGTLTTTLGITGDPTSSPLAVVLSGTAMAKDSTAALSPTSLTYPSQLVGTASAAKTITLTNAGTAALSVAGIVISGGSAGDFAQINNCGSSLASGANCTISVTFKPTAKGTRTSTLTVTDSATGSPQSAMLSGTATAAPTTTTASGTLSPTNLTYASQAVGTSSAAKTLVLSNSGTAAFSITSIVISGGNAGDFTQINNCGSSVASGANCTISVTFKPTAAGTRASALIVDDNITGSPQSAILSGNATAAPAAATATVTLSPTGLVFASQPISLSSVAQTITLTDSGAATLNITNFAVSGANSADFIQNNNCGSSVMSGSHCSIVVLFIPTGAGTRTAVLSVADNASGSPQSVSLSGQGSHYVLLSWSASPSADVVGYNVYRGTAPGGESSTPLNSTPTNGTTYIDAQVTAGTTYYYSVKSVTSDGSDQSAASPETSATIP
jgi:trimeric autotransporter adhesin